MKTTFLILLNKFATLVCKLFGRDGSVFPGSLVVPFDKNILKKIKYPKYVIGVTGSSGKGSTTSLVAHVLNEAGYKVVWNKSGSNLINAAVTLILNNSTFFSHKLKCDVLLMELDESYIDQIFDKGVLTHMVLTNITRDQPARNGHPELILEKIKKSIDPNLHLIINADDPFLNRFKYFHNGIITTYGIGKNKYSRNLKENDSVDAQYCPLCFTKLKYSFYHYGHMGKYTCPNCEFTRGKLDYEAKDINLDKGFFTINDSLIRLNKNIFFAVYYTTATYALCKTLGISEEILKQALNVNVMESKRMQELKIDDRPVLMLESKNENCLSYLQSLNFIKDQKGLKTVILGFDNVSRRYKENDLSWLYDVDFSSFNDESIDKIFCIGRFRYDVRTRLKYDNIDDDKIILVDNLNNLIDLIRSNSQGNIYTMVCFDMTAIIKKKVRDYSENN